MIDDRVGLHVWEVEITVGRSVTRRARVQISAVFCGPRAWAARDAAALAPDDEVSSEHGYRAPSGTLCATPSL
jgi:hypothetical protein